MARLRFKGRAAFSRSILLIYMVPMIVLALPIYIVFSMTGLRKLVLGYRDDLSGHHDPGRAVHASGLLPRACPAEVEEAGLDGWAERGLQVIWKITLPLALPALASVSLTLRLHDRLERISAGVHAARRSVEVYPDARRIASLNSSEIPRQHLMAGAVIATVPIMVLFLGLERFMTKGLTAGSR